MSQAAGLWGKPQAPKQHEQQQSAASISQRALARRRAPHLVNVGSMQRRWDGGRGGRGARSRHLFLSPRAGGVFAASGRHTRRRTGSAWRDAAGRLPATRLA
jgi:hypothetical protein